MQSLTTGSQQGTEISTLSAANLQAVHKPQWFWESFHECIFLRNLSPGILAASIFAIFRKQLNISIFHFNFYFLTFWWEVCYVKIFLFLPNVQYFNHHKTLRSCLVNHCSFCKIYRYFQNNSCAKVSRDGHKAAHELKFIMYFGCFVVHKVNRRTARNFPEFLCSLWWFVAVCDEQESTNRKPNSKTMKCLWPSIKVSLGFGLPNYHELYRGHQTH